MSKYKAFDTIQTLRNRECNYNYNIKTSLINSRFFRANEFYCKNLFAHYGCVNALEFSNDGEWFASGGDDRRVLLWNVEKNIVSNKYKPSVMSGRHASNIFCLAFDSTNSRIFSAGNDEQVIIHDAKTGESLDVFPHYEAIYSLAIDPLNDNIFVTACDDEVMVWDSRQSTDSTVLACCNSSFHAVVYNPVDTRILATANSNEGIGLWDIRQPRSPLFKFSDCPPCQSSMSVKFSSNGRFILSLRRRLPVGLFSLTSPYPIFEFDHPGYYNSCTMKSCCFAGENDEYIMSGSDDFNLYMWRVPEVSDPNSMTTWISQAHAVFKGHRSIVNQVRYNSARSIIASSGVEKIIKLWSPFPVPEFEPQPPNEMRRVFSQDDYIHMVLETGQYVTHDYSTQSTVEDPRMMAFFDSMVQRDVEGWSSPSTASSFCSLSQDSLEEFSSDLSEPSSSDELDEDDKKPFVYLEMLAKRIEEKLDSVQDLPREEDHPNLHYHRQQQQASKERIINLITKKKYQQVLKSAILSYKSSKRKYKANKRKMGKSKYTAHRALKSAKRVCLLYREKFVVPFRCKRRTFLIRRMDRNTTNSAAQELAASNGPRVRQGSPGENSESTRANSSLDSSSSSSSSSWSSSSSSKSPPLPACFRRLSKKHSQRQYRRPLSQMTESDTDIEHDMLACNNNNNGASKHKSLKRKFWGPMRKSLRKTTNGCSRTKNNRQLTTHPRNGSSSDSSNDDEINTKIPRSAAVDEPLPSTSKQDPPTKTTTKRHHSTSGSSSHERAGRSNLVRVKRFRNLRPPPDSSSSD